MSVRIILCSILCASAALGSPQIGGHNAEERKFIYQVSIRSTKNKHGCGGSIINKNWVLTAAHCYDNKHVQKRPSELLIVTGTNFLNKGGDYYRVRLGIPHPDYDKVSKENDICLLSTTKSIKFNQNTGPIRLASVPPEAGSEVTISGFGVINNDQLSPIHLKYRTTEIISFDDCSKLFYLIEEDTTGKEKLTTNNICTLNRIGEGDCRGDSGGPLVQNGVQVGVVSFGTHTCGTGAPDVYTNVANCKPWILQTIGKWHNPKKQLTEQ